MHEISPLDTESKGTCMQCADIGCSRIRGGMGHAPWEAYEHSLYRSMMAKTIYVLRGTPPILPFHYVPRNYRSAFYLLQINYCNSNQQGWRSTMKLFILNVIHRSQYKYRSIHQRMGILIPLTPPSY